MKSVVLDENWTFRRGFLEMVGMLDNDPGEVVNLPRAILKAGRQIIPSTFLFPGNGKMSASVFLSTVR